MVTEMLVKESLTEEMISAGAALVKLLDDAGLEVSGAFWFYESEANDWRLIIVTPQVHSKGLKAIYTQIQTVLRAMPHDQPKVSLKDISVADPSDSLISLLKLAIQTEKEVSRIRFARNMINGQLIEDSLIYRLT